MKNLLIAMVLLVLSGTVHGSESWVHGKGEPEDFPLALKGRVASLAFSPEDFPVVALAARDLATDLESVTGHKPALLSTISELSGPTVIVGTAERSPLIKALVESGKLNLAELSGAWESFIVTVVDDPFPGVPQALVIAGSDRRGTAFGIYELSQQIGVSPWHWWADVVPEKKSTLLISDDLLRFGPPSVKYRGIFINDEDWGLQPWAAKNFEPENGGIGPKTYAKVFELLLRLKANTLWPAMHECTKPFNADPRNAALADTYAIVMGSSHAEPMLRNNVGEWTAPKPEYNYVSNRDGVRAYWEERVRTNGRYENIYTIGMRGIHDSAIQGTKTDGERIKVLEQVFADQRTMLATHVRPEVGRVPQMFCAYKEVLDLYRQGLQVPDDVTIVWPDDNFGYIRNFTSAEERGRSGGFGVYYHISYLGRPLSYLWLNTTPPALIWEEMSKAYKHGADRIWIVNVGDIKPAEISTEFFLRLAWDIKAWGPDAQPVFLKEWAAREFGTEHASEIASVMAGYYQLNFQRRPEHLQWWLPNQPPRPSDFTPAETDVRLAAFAQLRERAKQIAAKLPPSRRDAFEELAGYPVHGSALANERYFLGERGETEPARVVDAALKEETRHFNESIAGGKWNGFMALEPADNDWKGMRIAPWTPLNLKPEKPAPIAGTITLDADAFTKKHGQVILISGLGQTGHAVVLTPTARLDYEITCPTPGNFEVRLQLLPVHPVVGSDIRLGISLDQGPVQAVIMKFDDGSPTWAQGVLNAARIATAKPISVPVGKHTLQIWGIDEGVVLDKITLIPEIPAPSPRL